MENKHYFGRPEEFLSIYDRTPKTSLVRLRAVLHRLVSSDAHVQALKEKIWQGQRAGS